MSDFLFLLEPFVQLLTAISLSILPGWGWACRLRLDPLTRIMVAAMTGFTLIYLVVFTAYCFSAPSWIPLLSILTLSLLSIGYALRTRSDSATAPPFPWKGLLAWTALASWILAMQFPVVAYGAVGRFGDWFEHYERSIFFLDQLSPNTKVTLGLWSIPARGPTFNTFAAFLMDIFGRDFWVYQVIATVLNTFPVLPLALLIRDIARIKQSSALLWSVFILGVAPFAVHLETYTNTKFFTVGFILGAIHLYRSGLAENRPWMAGWSFLALAAGMLAHYLAVIYVFLLAVHFLYVVRVRQWGWRVVVYPALSCWILLGTWFLYFFIQIGAQATLASNSTLGKEWLEYKAVLTGEKTSWPTAVLGNMITTAIPYSWRHEFEGLGYAPPILQKDDRFTPLMPPDPNQSHAVAEWFCDLANNQSSIPGNLGWAGSLGILIVVGRVLRTRKPIKIPSDSQADKTAGPPGWKFWLIFFLIGIPVNILPFKDYVPSGVAHANLQPYICLTAVFLLRYLKDLSLWVRGFLVTLFLCESIVTLWALHELQRRPVPIIRSPDGNIFLAGPITLNFGYVDNYLYKLTNGLTYLSDQFTALSGYPSLISVVIALLLLGVIRRPSSPPVKNLTVA